MLDTPGPGRTPHRRTAVTGHDTDSTGYGSTTRITVESSPNVSGAEPDLADLPTHVRDALVAWLLATDTALVEYLFRVGRAHKVAAAIWDRGDDDGPGSAPVPAMIPPGSWPPATEVKTASVSGIGPVTVTVNHPGEPALRALGDRARFGVAP